ncbi:MAG: hypothetical protein MdMp014T_2673 [Treponematales bacterium]
MCVFWLGRAAAGWGEGRSLPEWELLWKGTALFEEKAAGFGVLSNRADFRLEPFGGAPGWGGVTLRAQALDRRGLPGLEGVFAPGLGLYHKASGSRLLWGSLEERGLPARTRNVWARAAPFAESHAPSARDLKTEPAAQAKSEAHLYLSLPKLVFPGTSAGAGGPALRELGAFAYGSLDEELNGSAGGGAKASWRGGALSAEGFYTARTLAPRKATAWFSPQPPLPERDFVFRAVNLTFTSPHVSAATDWAFSETFAFGSGVYGNIGLTANLKPWRVSLAADGAGSRFVGRDGAAPGAGFRLAGKGERRGRRASLLRLSAALTAPAWGEGFERSSTAVYWRLPAAPAPKKNARRERLPRLTRVSFSMDRDARDRAAVMDRYEVLTGLGAGTLGAAVTAGLDLKSAVSAAVQPFPVPLFAGGGETGFHAAKVSGEVSWRPGGFQFSAKTACAIDGDGGALWAVSASGAFTKKPVRVSLKISAENLPETAPKDLSCTLSWSVERK